MPHKKKQKVVNYWKLIYTPLIIMLLAIGGISITSILNNKKFLLEQMREEGIHLATQVTKQIADNHKALKSIDEMLEDKIRMVGRTVIRNKNHIDNNYLKELLEELEVTELHWMNENGRILYSTIEGYLGWTPDKDHPLYEFILLNDIELIEDIRPDVKYGQYVKYGAIKDMDGSFVQVGIEANLINQIKEAFSYQKIVESINNESNIEYVIFVDESLKAIAHSQNDSIGEVYYDDNILIGAVGGEISATELYLEEIDAKIFDIAIPVYHEDVLIGALNIGFSIENLYDNINKNTLLSVIVSLVIFIIFVWIQIKNVIKPVVNLEKSISKINIENNMLYKLPDNQYNTFKGLIQTINQILEKTYLFFNEMEDSQKELKISNEELSAAYEQLTASEEELRAQYDEINEQKDYIEHLAYHDFLTELPNRRGFLKFLNEELHKYKKGTVMLLDLDNFKEINDTLGHGFGDKVLKKYLKISREYLMKSFLYQDLVEMNF